jgi:type II secretory pathway component PulF
VPATTTENGLNKPDANPYASPSRALGEGNTSTAPRKFGLLFWLIAGAAGCFSFLLAIVGTFAVPAFMSVYSSFGADLPWATAFVVSTRYFWSVAPALVVGLWIYSLWAPARLQYRTRLMLLFAFLAVGSMATLAFVVVALYLPIFTLGEVVK